jgi:hypothetical protein
MQEMVQQAVQSNTFHPNPSLKKRESKMVGDCSEQLAILDKMSRPACMQTSDGVTLCTCRGLLEACARGNAGEQRCVSDAPICRQMKKLHVPFA